MTSDRSVERCFSRRKLLSGISALTLPSLLPHAVLGQTEDRPLAISAADSLASYVSLWSVAESATYRGIAVDSEAKYEDCTTSLEDLKGALQQLKSRLEHVPHKANWPMIENHLNSLQRGLVLTSSGDRGDQYVRVTNFLPSTTAALVSLIEEISADCNPDPDGKIKALLQQILDKIAAQNNSLEVYARSREQLAAQLNRIAAIISEGQRQMEAASVSLAIAYETGSQKDASKAVEYLRVAREQLSKLPSPNESAKGHSPSAQDTLDKLLEATIGSLTARTGSLPASLSLIGWNDPAAAVANIPAAKLDASNATLVDFVRSVVRNPNPRYFTPGVPIQIINCISVCWPVWLFYLDDSEAATRKRLIQSALEFPFPLIWGADRRYSDAIAEKLQGAYLFATGVQRT